MTIRDGIFPTASDGAAWSAAGGAHPLVDELITLHEGRLAEGDAERLRDHLAVCPECSSLMLEIDEFPGRSPDRESGDLEVPSSSLWTALEKRLAAAGEVPRSPPRLWAGAVRAAPRLLRTAAVVLLALALGLLLSLRENRRLAGVVAGQRLELEALAERPAPRADLPFMTLTPRSFARDPSRAAVLELTPEAAFFALHLTLAGHRIYPDYRLETIAPDGEIRGSLRGLVPREHGFTLLLSRRELGPGLWHLKLFGLAEGRGGAGEWLKIRELEGDAEGDFFGWAVAGAGNLNGAGNTDDIVVTSPLADGLTGKVVAFDDARQESVLATYRDAGLEPGALFGWSLAVGNVTDDLGSFTEILIGAPGSRIGDDVTPQEFAGKAYAFPWHAGAPPKVFEGEAAGDLSGFSVDDAGDLGGPGSGGQMIVGAPAADGLRGKAYVFAPDNQGELLYTLSGRPVSEEAVPADAFGFRVRGVGDVDRDGTGDLLVAARYCQEPFCLEKGKLFLYSGAAAVGDPNRWLRTFRNQAGHERDLFGLALAGAGDLDGDGKPDLVVGAPHYECGPDREEDSGALHTFAACSTGFGDDFEDAQLDRCRWKAGNAFLNTVQTGQAKGWIWEGTDGVLAAHFPRGPYTICGSEVAGPFLYRQLPGTSWTVETELEFQRFDRFWSGAGIFVRAGAGNRFGILAGRDGNAITSRFKRVLAITAQGATRILNEDGQLVTACWQNLDGHRPRVPDLGLSIGSLLRATVKIVRDGDAFDVYWKTADGEYEHLEPEHTMPSCSATVCLPGAGETVDVGYSGHAAGQTQMSFVMNAKSISGAIVDSFDDEEIEIDLVPPYECGVGSSSAWCLENGDPATFFEGTGGRLRIALTTAKSELRTRFWSVPSVALEALGGSDPSWSGTVFDVETAFRPLRMDSEGESMYLVARKPGDAAWAAIRLAARGSGLYVASLVNDASELTIVDERPIEAGAEIELRMKRSGEVFEFFYRPRGEACWRDLGSETSGAAIGEEIRFHLAASGEDGSDLVADFGPLRRAESPDVCP